MSTGSPLSPFRADGDRRKAPRTTEAQGETVLVWITGQPPQTAIFLDESPYGIGVALREHVPLQTGQRVEVVFRGTPRTSTVSSLRSYQDVLRVGLQWTDLEGASSA